MSDEVNGKYVQVFDIRNIYLTPEGYVRVYPFPIDIEFESSPMKLKRASFVSGSMMAHN